MSEFKVGDMVNYHPVVGGPISSMDHEIKAIMTQPNRSGDSIAWITRKPDFVGLDSLSLVGEQ